MHSTDQKGQGSASSSALLMEGPPGPVTTFNGRSYLYFGGVSYYSLHGDPALLEAGSRCWQDFGTGSATSRAGFGNNPLLLEVESSLSRFFATNDAVYLPSGYLSNTAGVQALLTLDAFDSVFIDEHAHYCLRDSAAVSGKPVHIFAHREPDDLERKLREELTVGQRPLVMSDGLFPLFGHLAPLPEYLEIVTPYDGLIWLDDAHPAGILGPNGRGTCDHFDIDSPRVLHGGTLAKAFGAFGGFIAGPSDLLAAVRSGDVVNGATPPPTPLAAASLEGLRLVAEHPEWREQLWSNARRLKNGLRELGLEVDESEVPIVAWHAGDGNAMEEIHRILLDRGIAIQYAHYPGSGPGSVLRAVVFSTHTEDQIDRLIDELARLL